jgi:D-alanyl-D-alanine dipeptidase
MDVRSRGRLLKTFFVILVFLAAALPGTPRAIAERQDFVDVAKHIPSVKMDIRYYTTHNFVGERIDGYNAPKCLLTARAANALKKVEDDLGPFSMSLKIYDCYRPQRAVDHFVRWARDTGDIRTKKEFYPTVDKSRLFKDGYIAQRSGHSRGSTVDLTIIPIPAAADEAFKPGQELFPCFLSAAVRFGDSSLDMGTGFDCFHARAHTANTEILPDQRVNRLLLRSLMEKHGFVNYDLEWWHFTLKNEPFPDTYFDFPIE